MNVRRRDVVLAYVAALVFVLVATLDRDRAPYAHHAAIFSVIVSAISWLGGILGSAGAAISSTLVGAVTYLSSAVGWLAVRVAGILSSTGGMFARVWEGARIVWADALKPALLWLDNVFTRIQTWLKDVFAPVFKWLDRVRTYINDVYTRFVRPIVDTIEFIRQLNRVLLTFHITVLQQLDDVLAQLERRIEEPILWIYARLTEVQNAVNFIVTADGFFQRLTLLRSMDRYAPAWMRSFWDKQVHGLSGQARVDAEAREVAITPTATYGVELGKTLRGEAGAYTAYVVELGSLWRETAGDAIKRGA